MTFGQPVPESVRLPFRRPAEASYYTPRLPRTGFFSHLHPFAPVLNPLRSFSAHLPKLDPSMQPGTVRVRNPGATAIRQELPAVAMQPTLPTPGPITGFFGAGGAGGRSGGVDPYRVMRAGTWPGIRPGGQNVRGGIVGAGQFIRGQTPGAFTAAHVPAGTYTVG